jgi:hypothetical protein
MLVEWLDGGSGKGLAAAISAYRVDGHGAGIRAAILAHNRELVLEVVLDRWGYDAEPKQPTRGLFGTRNIGDDTVTTLAERLGKHLFAAVPKNTDAWHKHLNWMQAYAPDAYRKIINAVFEGDDVNLWSQAYAPGYVLGNSNVNVGLHIGYVQRHGFAHPNGWYPKMHWWSIFRMLCWHPETQITATQSCQLIDTFCNYANTHAIPWQVKKYSLLVILYALRCRETDKNALDPNGPICGKLVTTVNHCLLRVKYPPTMIANMAGLIAPDDDLSKYVLRFIRGEDTLVDRELGAGIATMK